MGWLDASVSTERKSRLQTSRRRLALDRLARTKNTVKKAMTPAQLAEAERQVRHRLTKSRKIEPSPSNQTPLAYEHSIGA